MHLEKEAKFLWFGKEPPIYNILLSKEKEVKEKLMENYPELRDYLHEARMAFKNVEYPRVLHYANAMRKIVNNSFDFSGLDVSIQQALKEFHGSSARLNKEQLEELQKELGELEQKQIQTNKESNLHYELISNATPMQWIKEHLPTSKEIDSKFYEKIFKNMLNKQKEGARTALKIAETIFESVKEIFKKLKTNRNNFDKYVNTINSYKNNLNLYKTTLATIYNKPEFRAALDPNIISETPEIKNQIKSEIIEVQKPDETKEEIKNIEYQHPFTTPTMQETLPEIDLGDEPPDPAKQQQLQLSEFDWANMNPINTTDIDKSATSVVQLIKRADIAAANGNYGIAVALLTKASEICDNNNDEYNAISLLNIASEMLKK
jgi:hypothetical protein